MITKLCVSENVSVSELARQTCQSLQNFDKKLKRDTVTFDEMLLIAGTLGVDYEQAFILPNGEKIRVE